MTKLKDLLWFENFKNEFYAKNLMLKSTMKLVSPDDNEAMKTNFIALYVSYGVERSWRQSEDFVDNLNDWYDDTEKYSRFPGDGKFKTANGKYIKFRFATEEEVKKLINHYNDWLRPFYNVWLGKTSKVGRILYAEAFSIPKNESYMVKATTHFTDLFVGEFVN